MVRTVCLPSIRENRSCLGGVDPPSLRFGGARLHFTICLANRVHTCPGVRCQGVSRRPTASSWIFDGSIFLPAADQDPRNTRASRINIHDFGVEYRQVATAKSNRGAGSGPRAALRKPIKCNPALRMPARDLRSATCLRAARSVRRLETFGSPVLGGKEPKHNTAPAPVR